MNTLTLTRYEINGDSIHSIGILTTKNTTSSYCFIEKMGKQIPTGTYRTFIYNSPKFGKRLYSLYVDGRKYIHIHHGNTTADTDGCLIIGTYKWNNSVAYSQKALNLFHALSEWEELIVIIKNEKTSGQNFNNCIIKIIRNLIKRIRKMVKH